MRVQEIRQMSDEEIQQELDNSQREMMNLRFRHATRQLTNTSEIGIARKTIARLKTVARERELQRVAE